MDKSILSLTADLTPALGFATMIGLGLFLLILSFAIKTALVRNTHDFIIADRKVFGFGFGVGSVIAVWTWAMAVMMSSAMTFRWGLSGLSWFVVPNGFAVIAMIPSPEFCGETCRRATRSPNSCVPLPPFRSRLRHRHRDNDLRHPARDPDQPKRYLSRHLHRVFHRLEGGGGRRHRLRAHHSISAVCGRAS